MKTHITLEDLKAWDACYLHDGRDDLLRALFIKPVSVIDLLTRTDGGWAGVSLQDRLWVVLRSDVLSDRILRLFACNCAERALARMPNPDPRSVQAVAVARRFALGQATSEELWDAYISASVAVAAVIYAASAEEAAVLASTYAAASAVFAAVGDKVAANTAAAKAAARAELARQIADLIELIQAEGVQP
jgi:hypothetical protein